MLNSIIKNVLLISFLPFLFACNGFFEKDNTPTPKPLVEFKPKLKPTLLWSVNTRSGKNENYLKYTPVVTETTIFTISTRGIITATNRINGHQNWQVDTRLVSTAGLAYAEGLVIAASSQGEVLALQSHDGQVRWKTAVPGEILANPAAQNGRIIIKTVNGHVVALSAHDGKILWIYNQVEPNLILRSASMPIIQNDHVIVGFANGNLAKLNLDNGQLAWVRAIAIPEGFFPIQRMIDIDANPIVFQQHIYAATYQGKLASLDWTMGKTLWTQAISSYTGMTVNSQAVYLSDASSHIWSFNAGSGLVNWRQTQLEWRQVTAPALMENRYLVVGDAQGYIHWLDTENGQVAAREFAGASVYATPIVKNNILYIMTSNGYLLAYTLRR